MGLFKDWGDRWLALGRYTGTRLVESESRIDAIIANYWLPIPDGWQRGIDPQLHGDRYRRGNRRGIRRGEHELEYQILEECFGRITVLGESLVDGVCAMPLARDVAGGTAGNVQADLFLLVQTATGHRLHLVEVKVSDQHAFYAVVENLRQVRLLNESPDALRLFHRRNPHLDLPDNLPVSGMVLAPGGFFTARGQKSNATVHARSLARRMADRGGCEVHLATWDRDAAEVRHLQADPR